MKQILQSVVSEFMALTEIPRPSHHEERVAAYLCKWAKEHDLVAEQDTLGNVIINKPASSGYEGSPLTILQAHMDMVCVCEETVSFDPIRDPIRVINDGKTITADGTSLGADDGIGVAMVLYVLSSDTLRHGPLRAIFTANEEDGMDAINMDDAYFTGDYLINLDWEKQGSLCNSCAGGDFYIFSRNANWQLPPADSVSLNISLRNLMGGHSGSNIHLGRANALVSLATAGALLRQGGIDFYIADFSGGQAPNAIPKSGKLILVVDSAQADRAMRMLDEYAAQFSAAFHGVEEDYELSVTVGSDIPQYVLTHEIGYDLIDLLVALPNNIHTMSPFVQNLVESSSNIGTVTVDDKQISLVNFARSSVEYHAVQLGTICEIIARRCGFTCKAEKHIPGWAVNPDSKLVPMTCKAYQQLTGRDMVVEPIHAGIECGAFAQKNPHLDMISIGPTLSGVHTPEECCYLEDVKLTTELLIAVLEKIAELSTEKT